MDFTQLRAVLHGLGIDQRTVPAVALLPLVQVAWADGAIQEAERSLILSLAERRGLLEGDGARLLEGWLRFRPSPGTFRRGREALSALARQGDTQVPSHDVVGLCEQVAQAAGGLFGMVATVDDAERAVLAELVEALHIDPRQDWDGLLDTLADGPAEGDDDFDEPTVALDLDTSQLPGFDDEAVTAQGSGLRLVLLHQHPPESLLLRGTPVTVGRRSDNTVAVPGDGQLSRQHCRVFREQERWYVVDCGSLNGTFVNGEQVLERQLFHGDHVTAGQVRFRFLTR